MSPRKRIASKWPWPADSVLQQRERVARDYREALREVAPDVCARLDAKWGDDLGQKWVIPTLALYEADDLLTAELLADYAGIQPRTVDLWASRGLRVTRTSDGNRYRWGDVLNFQAERRKQRKQKARRARTATVVGPGTADVP